MKPPSSTLLRQAGYRSFSQFMRSPKFANIRKRVLVASKNLCAHCGRPAYLVHWLEFTLANLRGSDLRGIDAVCRRCLEEWADE